MSTLEVIAHARRGAFQLDIELNIPQQGITAILGPSGSGKSSLLRLLAGLDKLQQGSIRFGDMLWADAKKKYHLPVQKRHIGMVFQDYALFEHMNVSQNIAYGISPSHRQERLDHCLPRMHLEELSGRYPSQLSGGQRQRVALARALITRPSLLLLDEPFSAVDANLRQSLRQQLKASVTEAACPVMLVTHYLEDVYYLADYIGVMVEGQVLQFGDKQYVLHQPNCKRVAELVGWQNFLPIRGITQDHVYGDWGEYMMQEETDINVSWLAIRAEHVQLISPVNHGIQATVEEVYELGMTRVIVCRLQGGGTIQKYQGLEENAPLAGSKVSVLLPREHVLALPEYSTGKQAIHTPLHVVRRESGPMLPGQHEKRTGSYS